MRIEITGRGIYGPAGEVPVGTIIETSAEPTGLDGRYRVLSDEKGKTPVINPLDHDGDGKDGGAKPNDPPSERDELKKQAAELGLEFPANIRTDKLRELIDAKLAS
jgi:hypothetical protein